ncbi:hypothetical protein KUCAC02_004337, partial [Chaenocephalus aceratus]
DDMTAAGPRVSESGDDAHRENEDAAVEEQIDSCQIPGLKWVHKVNVEGELPLRHEHLPDIEEVKDKSIKKGTNAFRVYKMLSSSERMMKKVLKSGFFFFLEIYHSLAKGVETPREGTQQPPQAGSPSPIKQEALEFTVIDSVSASSLPFVCQTIEVTTENEEQTVSSSHSYPLQISPVSSCCGSDTDSDTE